MDLAQNTWWDKFQNTDNAQIIDVRSDEEVASGKIPNSKQIDFYSGQAFLDELNAMDKTKNYFVYCASGNRSGQTCLIMKQLGFQNVNNLVGGMAQWEGPIE